MPISRQKISVIIPCLNDDEALGRCLGQLREARTDIVDFDLEVIVADASTSDTCADLAESEGASVVRCKNRGRGQQLNAGANMATGDPLVFNHADTELSAQHLCGVVEATKSATVVGGAFYRDLPWQYPAIAWADRVVRAYTRYVGILYGDQSIFVRRDVFDSMGGFAEIPIMEDVEFSRRMRRQGKLALVDTPLRTSMRRFRRRGYLRNKLQNFCVVWLWRAGLLSPEQIYRWYYGRSVGDND